MRTVYCMLVQQSLTSQQLASRLEPLETVHNVSSDQVENFLHLAQDAVGQVPMAEVSL